MYVKISWLGSWDSLKKPDPRESLESKRPTDWYGTYRYFLKNKFGFFVRLYLKTFSNEKSWEPDQHSELLESGYERWSTTLLESLGANQCCGSGSTGSTCFWASWIRIRILLSLSKYSKETLLSLSKYSKENLDFFYYFLTLKNDEKVPSKSNMQGNFKKKFNYCWHIEVQWCK